MKVIAEHSIDLGDAGVHLATATGWAQTLGNKVHVLVDSVTVEVKGAMPIDVWPLMKINGLSLKVQEWLLDTFDRRAKSIIDAIKEQELRDRMECDA